MSIFFALNLPIQNEWERFAKLTTIQKGETALIASLHGSGLQDRKHLFIFQGSAEQFHAQAAALPWKPVESEDERITRYFSAYMTKVRQAFGAPDWPHVKIYEYFQFDDPFVTPQGQLLPRANAFLCPDATEERWFIFWDGM